MSADYRPGDVMSPEQRRRFDIACRLNDEAAVLGLQGFHAEASQKWAEAALWAVSVSGKRACIENARAQWQMVREASARVQ